MVEKTKNNIISLLNNEGELKKTDLRILKSISKKFPYFTPSRVLSLVLAKKFKTIDYSKILESAATNVTDRIHLYYILNNDILNDNEKKLIIKDFKEEILKNEMSFLEWLSKSKATPKSISKKIINSELNEFNLKNLKAKKHTLLNIKKKDYMTETLAELYVKQSKYKEALKAYKVLCLKYPEKISLFADQIKFIKKQIKNQ